MNEFGALVETDSTPKSLFVHLFVSYCQAVHCHFLSYYIPPPTKQKYTTIFLTKYLKFSWHSVNIRKYNKLFLTHEIWGPHSCVAEDSNNMGMSLCVMAQTVPRFL